MRHTEPRTPGAGEARHSPSRRRWLSGAWAVALGAVTILTSVGAAQDAQAQRARWWETLPGFSAPRETERAPRAREPDGQRARDASDLRTDPMPFRSAEMLELMERAASRYQQIVAAGGWRPIPAGPMLREGDIEGRVAFVRSRLIREGFLPVPRDGQVSTAFDGGLRAAIMRFQSRYGLRATGRIDRVTLASLNVSATNRLAQIRVNLVRLRELMARPQEPRYVLVNIPAFQLEAVTGGAVQLRHRVIVGKPDRQTPSIIVTIRGVNFFPYWRVPDSVAHLDLIPRLKKDPEYLEREHIRVLRAWGGEEIDARSVDWSHPDAKALKFRQEPGRWNALGLVRIDMPNEHIVYMHDTPLKTLFGQRGRAFSAGCVRVEGVFDLVKWILSGESGWDDPRTVDQVLATGEAQDVKLAQPIPVYFTYLTAWANRDGSVDFRADIYGRDGVKDLLAGYERPTGSGDGIAP
ncbi:MAG: L,D-transpeptidase family protein [Hyphomicrobiaceae bacterium]|nr:L,D-transpeptidase family protein [Hyphomicrobiaceae bacterium]